MILRTSDSSKHSSSDDVPWRIPRDPSISFLLIVPIALSKLYWAAPTRHNSYIGFSVLSCSGIIEDLKIFFRYLDCYQITISSLIQLKILMLLKAKRGSWIFKHISFLRFFGISLNWMKLRALNTERDRNKDPVSAWMRHPPVIVQLLRRGVKRLAYLVSRWRHHCCGSFPCQPIQPKNKNIFLLKTFDFISLRQDSEQVQ